MTKTHARFLVETTTGTREYYLGDETQISHERSILHWESAPLAEVYFSCAPGESYEIEHDGRTLSGTLLEKELLGAAQTDVRLAPRSAEARARPRFGLRVALDAVQQRAVDMPAHRSLLVLGEAGFGKTTVALYRLARLRAEAAAEGRAFSALVLVPTPGLAAASRELLDELGCPPREVEVSTTDAWLLRETRRILPKIPARESATAGAAVIRQKRDRNLAVLLPAIAGRRSGPAVRSDLLHLFGDRKFMSRETVEHTQVQFSQRTEREYAHVDAGRLETLDAREIDEGTPLEDAETIDAEDAPVLLEIHRLRTGRWLPITQYDHLVLDEAQELAALELKAIGCAVKSAGSITVAGDEHQQTDDTAGFVSWKQTCEDLGHFYFDKFRLEESHRCPPDVVRFARGLFERPGGAASYDPQQVLRTRHDGAFAQTAAIIEALQHLDDPRATVAVVCRTPESAARIRQRLARALPNIDVAPVEEVKGLEFDYVVLPDLSASTPPTAAAARALYVAVTRAIHQLWIAELA